MEHCAICKKPICPQCMEIFGYFCSAYCKGKAEAGNNVVPVYQNQKNVVEAKYWKKVGRIMAIAGLFIALFVGAWVWYEFFGSHPKVAFSIKFPERSYSGQCFLCSKDQIVVLHGGRLARHDMKSKKEIWSVTLIEKTKIADDMAKELETMKRQRDKAIDKGMDPDMWRMPDSEKMLESMERAAVASLQLHVSDERVWVAFPDRLVRFDWETGRQPKEIRLGSSFHRLISKGTELQLIEESKIGERITHINLATDELRVEEMPGLRLTSPASAPARIAKGDKPLDPAAIRAQAQNLSFPEKLALPATLSAAANQERALAEMRDTPPNTQPQGDSHSEYFESSVRVPDGNGFVRFTTRLVESKFISRQAMKAPPKKSALDGNVNASATAAVANELLNEMQRDRGGSTVEEDASRYSVRLRSEGGDAAEWSGEVIGRPQLFPQKTITALTAGKSVMAFDKSAKKLWESKLNYEVVGGRSNFWNQEPDSESGPCVERGDTLFVFDQGVLTAFDIKSGNVRWRLPSVGVSRLFFDDKGMLYVNTTTASPDNIKFSRQIDVTDRISSAIIKVDPKNGKLLWSTEKQGELGYVSGNFLYSVDILDGDEYAETDEATKLFQAFHGRPHTFIRRVNPSNGKILWQHYQDRPPLDIHFEKNRIELLFKREFQVLTFFSL